MVPLDGPNKKPFPESWPYTVQWLGNQPNRAEVAKIIAIARKIIGAGN